MESRKIKALSALFLSLALLTSCSVITFNKESTEDTTVPETEAVTDAESESTDTEAERETEVDYSALADSYLSTLPSRDFDGVAIMVAAVEGNSINPDNTEDIVDVERLKRIRKFEDMYNTTVIFEESASVTALYDALSVSCSANEYYCDLVAIPYSSVGQFALNGQLLNMNSLPFTNYSAAFFNSDATEQLTVNNTIYGVVGNFCTSADDYTCIVFDKDAFGVCSENPYSTVYSGSFTWEKYLSMLKEVTADNTDLCGVKSQFDTGTLLDLFAASSGEHYYSNKFGTLPASNYISDVLQSAVNSANSFIYSSSVYGSSSDLYSDFVNSKTASAICSVSLIKELADISVNWGLLPIPKCTEEQDSYYSYISPSSNALCVPAYTQDYEHTGIAVQALNAVFYGSFQDIYLNYYTNYVLRDNSSINMLDIVLSNGQLDFVTAFDSEFYYLSFATYTAFEKCAKGGLDFEESSSAYVSQAERELSKAFN